MKEARIHTKFGEISVTFQTTDELRDALQDLEEQVNVIQEMTNRIAPPLPRTAKPGYENAYRFASNGDLELVYIPKFRNEIVALVLFAFHPECISMADIKRFTGITNVSRLVLALPQNEKFIRKVDDKYGLTDGGLKLVQERIGAILNPSIEVEQPESQPRETEQSE